MDSYRAGSIYVLIHDLDSFRTDSEGIYTNNVQLEAQANEINKMDAYLVRRELPLTQLIEMHISFVKIIL
jgi:hypothetical protein